MVIEFCFLNICILLFLILIILCLFVKNLNDLVRKWEDVSPEMVADFLSSITHYYQLKNRGDL